MQDDRLRLGLELEAPLRLTLHRLQGFQSRRHSHKRLLEFREDLLLDQQMRHRTTDLLLEVRVVEARDNPIGSRSNLHALARGRYQIFRLGWLGVHDRSSQYSQNRVMSL